VRRNRRSRFVTSATRVLFRRAAALLVISGLAFAVSGCGRFGPLEPPPDAKAVAKPADGSTESLAHHKTPPIAAPKTPFVLDPLL
jgi:predicted small lipoprotein YifL